MNVIACQLATRKKLWYIVVCYLVPVDSMTIRNVEAMMAEKPKGTELIVVGDLNVELEKTGSRERDKEIVAAVATAGLEDTKGHHLLPRRRARCRDRRTWSMRRQGRVVRSRTDYILGSDRQIFHNVTVWDPSHNSDHFMVVGSMHGPME